MKWNETDGRIMTTGMLEREQSTATGESSWPLDSLAAVGEIQRAICEAAALPLSRATTLPARAYTSKEFFAWEADHLLRGGWQCVAHESQIPEAGDFLNLDLLGEPLIVVRGKDGAVRALSRVCPHRSMDIMPEGFGYEGHGIGDAKPGEPDCGHARLFLCPYHAWTFDLDGRLKACPEMHKADGFARDDFFLSTFKTEIWEGFVFVNLDGRAEPLAGGLAEMKTDLAGWKMSEMKLVIQKEWDCEFNWKVLVENFMESYHHVGIHSTTLQPMMPARDTWTEQERPGYVRAHLPYKPSIREELRAAEEKGECSTGFPTIAGLTEAEKGEWGLFFIPPSFLLASTPDSIIWYRLQPLGPAKLKLLTTTLVAPDVPARKDFETLRASATESLFTFHLEDMEVCTAVQRGLHSSAWKPGRLSHLEMPVWLIHRYIANRIRGTQAGVDSPAAPGQR